MATEISLKVEQRCAIRFCVRLGKTPTETIALIQQAYGVEADKPATVKKWHKQFREGRQSVADAPRTGRPVTASTDENVETIRDILLDDRRTTLRHISAVVGISLERADHIVTNVLQMRRVCARWVPRALTDDHKRQRRRCCENWLSRLQDEGEVFLNKIVTGDEVWLYQYDPETKQQSSVWKHPASPPPKKFRAVKSTVKTLAIIFMDVEGIILTHYVPRGVTVNGKYYAGVIRTNLREAIRKKRGHLLQGGWLLHHDNARPHITADVQAAVRSCNAELLEHPPYSPDLAPCDFWLFPKMKEHLRGRHFMDVEEIKRAATAAQRIVIHGGLLHVFRTWEKRCCKCLELNGGYVEKDEWPQDPNAMWGDV
jgi:[histone H3]-lysine36 N-dimethyltransferase SETMAR